MQRPRPEAYKGESLLGFMIFDGDNDLRTIHDQSAMGGGPSRSDPLNMGRLVIYEADPWRSIFDSDTTDRLARYQGDCAAVDRHMQERKSQSPK